MYDLFTLEIQTTNLAFENRERKEIAGILRELATELESGAEPASRNIMQGATFVLRDSNGNRVGFANLK